MCDTVHPDNSNTIHTEEKMKSLRKIVSLILVLTMVMGFAGCVLNEEKDAKAVIATIDGVEYLKGDFNDYYSFYCFIQEAYGSPLTGTDEEMQQYRENLFKEYVFTILAKTECEAASKTVSESLVEESVSSLIETAKTSFEGTAYTDLLKKYGYTEETIEETATEMLTFIDYSNLYLEENIGNNFDSVIASTVEGQEISMATFYYYALVNYLSNVLNGASIDFYDTEEYYPTVYTYLTTGAKAIKYLEDNNITIPEETILEQEDNILMFDLYGLTDYAKNVCMLTSDQITAASEFVVNALAAQDVILTKFGEDTEFTDSELEAYYNSSASKYDASYVKAYHILTEDKDFAQKMLDETGMTKDGFMAVYEKYGSDEKVKEAADLGQFGRGEMVTEFEDCAFGLKAGEIGMCDTEFGTHIVYVYESNITDTTFESVKDQVLEDYRADHIQYFGQAHLGELIEGYEDEEGDYKVIPTDLLNEYLYDKHSVKLDTKAAVR